MPEQDGGLTRLTGWKEIGAYLGRAPRTVQRWERDYALPVHRTGSGRSESVVAYAREIDAWLKTTSGAKARGGPTRASAQPPAPAVPPPAVLPQRDPRVRRTVIVAAVITMFVAVGVVATWRATASRADGVGAAGPLADAVAIYHLDEQRGTELRDANPADPGRANGAVTNGAWTAGVSGGALDFAPGHQSGQELRAVFPGTFPFHGIHDASLSFWVRPADATHRTVFWTRGDAHSPDANRFHIYVGGVHRVVGSALGVDYLSPAGSHHLLFEVPIRLREWTHVALVRDGATRYRLYLDGEEVGAAEDVAPQLPDYKGDWALWRTQDNPYPRQNAAVDEIALWTRALGAAEVKALARRNP